MRKTTITLLALCLLIAPLTGLADEPKVEAGTPKVEVVKAKAEAPKADVKVVAPKAEAPKANDSSDPEEVIEDAIENIDENPAAVLERIVSLAKEGRWGPAIGLILMFLVWIIRRWVWKLVPKNVLPWLALSLGMVATLAVELSLSVVWWKAIIDGFMASGIAIAFWSAMFKHFLKVKKV